MNETDLTLLHGQAGSIIVTAREATLTVITGSSRLRRLNKRTLGTELERIRHGAWTTGDGTRARTRVEVVQETEGGRVDDARGLRGAKGGQGGQWEEQKAISIGLRGLTGGVRLAVLAAEQVMVWVLSQAQILSLA